MTDKELIQALREDAEWAQANERETPITLSDNLTEAADRMEALLAENERRTTQCCRSPGGRLKTAGGYRWFYADEFSWKDLCGTQPQREDV